MNIEESIEIVKCLILYPTNWIVNKEKYKGNLKYIGSIEGNEAIKTLLTAYEKEKEKNDRYFKQNIEYQKTLEKLQKETVWKDKIKWKPIKAYDRQKYDWVLVKYFDGDYECVPEVAEKRSDGKWYTSEKQIPFEVKYFFDMQEIIEEE